MSQRRSLERAEAKRAGKATCHCAFAATRPHIHFGGPRGFDPEYHRKVRLDNSCPGTGRDPIKAPAVLKGQFICPECLGLVSIYGMSGKIRPHLYTVDYIWR